MSDRVSTNKATPTESLCAGSETKVGKICLDPDKRLHCEHRVHQEVIGICVLHKTLSSVYFYVDLSQFVDSIQMHCSDSLARAVISSPKQKWFCIVLKNGSLGLCHSRTLFGTRRNSLRMHEAYALVKLAVK